MKFGMFENKYLIGAFILGTLMQVIVVIIPNFAEVFKLVPLTNTQWLYTLGISVLPLIIIQFQKRISNKEDERTFYSTYLQKRTQE